MSSSLERLEKIDLPKIAPSAVDGLERMANAERETRPLFALYQIATRIVRQ